MKTVTLKSIALFLLFAAVGCSDDSVMTGDPDQSQEKVALNRGSYWNQEVGFIDAQGKYVITMDMTPIKADLEGILRREGNETTLVNFEIVKKYAANMPGEFAYMFIAGDGKETTVGLWLTEQSNSFHFEVDDQSFTSVSCKGCASGCNLDYWIIDGKKIRYCNLNGCSTYNCEKSESEVR